MSAVNSTMKAERKTSFSSVKSREQLLESEAAYFAHEIKTMKQRRTKIIATLCESVSSVDDIRSFLQSGMDIIRVNMAYCDQKTLEIIMKNKAIVEKELGCFIPIIMDLKGNTLRLGSFDLPRGEVPLKRGDEFRISTNKKIRGNEHIISCDCSDLGKLVHPGDKLLVDYGRNVLIVKSIEKESETSVVLREKCPLKYDKGLVLQKLSGFKSASHGDMPFNHASLSMSSNEEDASETSPKSRDSIDERDEINSEKNETTTEPTGRISHRRRFEYAFKKKKKIEKDVIVCEAESDCVIQSTKPIFIHSSTLGLRTGIMKAKSFSVHLPDSDNGEELSCINVRDIKDLNHAMKLDVDSIAITGARTKKDVEEARFILGPKSHIKVITKIQNAVALENFDEILEASDGIIISRNYLSLHIPVEKLFFKQKEMIQKCHIAGKPVTIVSQVLESMVQGLVPTSSEVNDIANLILDGVDSLTLVTETTYGAHKKETLETLSRICFEIEYNEVTRRQKEARSIDNLTQIGYVVPKPNIASPSTSQTIASCAIKAVNDTSASLIIAFTQTGSTILKLSKLRSPCPILAVTISEKIARQVSLLASVTAIRVGSMYGKEGLLQKVVNIAQEKNWVQSGDFVVVTFGDVEGVAGKTNSLKIIKV